MLAWLSVTPQPLSHHASVSNSGQLAHPLAWTWVGWFPWVVVDVLSGEKGCSFPSSRKSHTTEVPGEAWPTLLLRSSSESSLYSEKVASEESSTIAGPQREWPIAQELELCLPWLYSLQSLLPPPLFDLLLPCVGEWVPWSMCSQRTFPGVPLSPTLLSCPAVYPWLAGL